MRDPSASAPTIVLAGRPNVGKSTLFNRLTRSRQALVDSTPGVTRDRRYAWLQWQGLTLRLVDSGGLDSRLDADEITRLTHEQSLVAIAEADLVLLILDGREGLTVADREIVAQLRHYDVPILFLVNKVDGPGQEVHLGEFYELGAEELVPVSAEHGRGIRVLQERVLEILDRQGWGQRLLAENKGSDLEKEKPGLESPQAEEDQVIRVTVLGRPNVGKSSLVNRLIGAPRMIVTDVPGTTRDAIDTLVERPGARALLLTDTAGVRRKAKVRERVEKFSILKTLNALKTSDIALVILDATEGVTDQDRRLLGYTAEAGRACIAVFNKWDLVQGDPHLASRRRDELKEATRFIPYAPHLFLSAKTGRRVSCLFPLIETLYEDHSARISTGRLNQALKKTLSLRHPPISQGHHIRLYYTTQVATRPPTFLIFANYPQVIPESYQRFLANQFRVLLDLRSTPIRILFRERDRRG